MATQSIVAAKVRERDLPAAKYAFTQEVMSEGRAMGFVKRKAAAVERHSRSTTVASRSASTTCSETSGKRARRDPNANVNRSQRERDGTFNRMPTSLKKQGRRPGVR